MRNYSKTAGTGQSRRSQYRGPQSPGSHKTRNTPVKGRNSPASRRGRQRALRRKYLAALGLLICIGLVLFLLRSGKNVLTSRRLASVEYPESLIEMMEKYPETTQFVLDYPKNKDRHDPIDLTEDVIPGEIPLFLQWDERWGYETYGNNFLAVNGCGPTCLSMVTCGLTGDTDWNPYQVACMADSQSYYVDGVGSSWDLMDSGARYLGLTVHTVTFDADHIIETLQAGMPIICTVGPGDFTSSGHFIVLAKVHSDGTIQVLDPNSKKNSQKTWDIEGLIPQIRNLWAYSI
ncbi:MAG: papain-like cysteine protease family protein [Candidatus Limivivens sp.]|nr:papain-like cysteine protease family protein [Candidatus Limivivens sp.]